MPLRAYVPRPVKRLLAPVYRRIRPAQHTVQLKDFGELEARLRSEGYLDDYGVGPENVALAFRVKDDGQGEPTRKGTYTRKRFEMKDYELLFTLRALKTHAPAGGRVLDIGSGSSLVPFIYRAVGFDAVHHDLHATDLDEVDNQVTCDVLELSEHCPPRSLDAVTVICAMEHFGLGRYRDAQHPRGDFLALEQIRAVLKPDGLLVLTVPFGQPALVYNTHRVYDEARLRAVLHGFEVLEEEYRAWPDWRTVSKVDATVDLELSSKRPGKNFTLALWLARNTASA